MCIRDSKDVFHVCYEFSICFVWEATVVVTVRSEFVFLENAGWIPCQWVLPIQPSSVLRVSLEDGDVPIDNSASERAIRTFCLDKKNWMFHNTANGAAASAMVYSISETAKLNNLRPYYYFKYILTELPTSVMNKDI